MSRTLNGMERIRRRRTAFALLLMAWPVFMFVFGQVLNLNMFYMAFHNYGRFGTANPIFVGWDNFVGVFRMFDETIIGNEWEAVTNSLQVAGVTLFINAPISLLFSYLLFSKVPAYKTLRALLYLPCVTSAVVLVLIFRGVFESGPLEMVYQLLGIADKYPVNGWFVQGRAWPVMQIFNIFRNRWCGAYWASKGIRVIPSVNWGDESTFDFCFDGVEKGSIVAVSTYMALEHDNRKDQ